LVGAGVIRYSLYVIRAKQFWQDAGSPPDVIRAKQFWQDAGSPPELRVNKKPPPFLIGV